MMVKNPFSKIGHKTVTLVESFGLLIIGTCTVIAVGVEVASMVERKEVLLADLLLLFVYLEIFAMVSNYLDSGKLPVRKPLYIAMVALARYLILEMKAMSHWDLIGISISIFVISTAVLVHRYGHYKFPYHEEDMDNID